MHFFRKYRGIPVIKRYSLSLSKVRPSSEYGVLWRGSITVENSRRGMVCRGKNGAGLHGKLLQQGRIGGELWRRKTLAPRRSGSRFPLGLCGSLSFLSDSLSFFPFFGLLSFFLFLSLFFDLSHPGTGKRNREVAAWRWAWRLGLDETKMKHK
jgi:hypothetical protein